MTQAYPLTWPPTRQRTAPSKRRVAPFSTTRHGTMIGNFRPRQDLTISVATDRLIASLDRLGAHHVVISTNVALRNDGLPRSGAKEPDDPGVAVYFQLNAKPICMPCDTYTKVAGNLAALAAHIEATRMIERHGVASIAEMFSGFAMIAAPNAVKPWWEVLGCPPDASPEVIKEAYRFRARVRHPDNGGSDALMSELNAARDRAMKERAA